MSERPLLRHPLLASLILAAIICLVVGGIARSGLLNSVELEGHDLLVYARGSAPPPEDLVIVDFDEASVQAYNAFPIPRLLLAQILNKISAGGPAVIGLDVLLDKRRADAEDRKLADALKQVGNVILVSEYGFGQTLPAEPLPQFRDAAAGVAFGDLPKDEDGFVRRMYLEVLRPDYQGLSFPVALADYYSGKHLQPGGPGFLVFGNTKVPLVYTNPDSALVNFSPSFPARTVSVQRLLANNFDPAVFQGRIVLLGQSSTFGKDLYDTPAFRFRPPTRGRTLLSGAEVHAAAVATLLASKTVGVLSSRWLWTLSFLLIWLLIALVATTRPAYGVTAVVAGALGTYLFAQLLFSQHRVWMKFLSTETGVVLTLPAGLGYRFLEERRLKGLAEAERRQLMGLFERYVSAEVAAEIWERRNEIVLAGEERTATVLFSDIRNFTALTAGKPSAEVLAWLNNYLTAMSAVIKTHSGFLNKFIGDGIMVLFGVPLSKGVETDACRAVQAALDMLEWVKKLNARATGGQPHLKIGVGIHTGKLTAGNVGSPDRLEYSVIGETVNMASRLESLTKEFKTGIVLSPQTAELVRAHFELAPLGETEVRGFQGKIPFFTVKHKLAVEVKR